MLQSVQSCLYYTLSLHIHPPCREKPFLPTPLASPVSTSHPPPPTPPSLVTPSPSPSLLAAPPGRLIDSVPGGGDHATFLIWLPLLQIKATSLHPSTPPLSEPSISINPSSSFLIFYVFHIVFTVQAGQLTFLNVFWDVDESSLHPAFWLPFFIPSPAVDVTPSPKIQT